MSYNPDEGYPRIFPHILYENVAAAASWLAAAFGFREVLRWVSPDGTVMLVEMELAGGAVFLTFPGPDYQNPQRHGNIFTITSVFVDNVDEQFQAAIAVGASVVAEPEDKPWGLRECRVDDPEGHRWELLQHIRDVSPEDWGATVTA